MSTCSTGCIATSTHRGNESRRRRCPPSSEAVRGHLEMRLQDLERDWDAYKAGRSSAPRHRRSRSAGSLSSSAVTAAEPDDGFHISLLRRSPRARRLVSSLQQTGSAADVPEAGPCDNKDASIVCSVEGVTTYSTSCWCSCPSQRDVLCCSGYSTSSSCTGTTVPPFSSDINGGRLRKMDEGKLATSRALWISCATALLVVGFVAMVILVLGVDECRSRMEYQVPT